MKNRILKILDESAAAKIETKKISGIIESIAQEFINCYKRGGKLIFAGNGGSAADCQHLVTELVCRFEKDREPFDAVALTTNTSLLTAISNDYDFNGVFRRQVESCAKQQDVLAVFSTSGNSKNIIAAAEYAKNRGITVVGFTGISGGDMEGFCDIIFKAPSDITARIQEVHITVGHIICKLIEDELF